MNWGVAINGKFAHANINLFSEAKSKKTLKDILEEHPEKYFFFTEDTLKRIENSEYVNKYYNGVKILYNQKGGARMGYSIFGVDGVAPTLTCTTSRHHYMEMLCHQIWLSGQLKKPHQEILCFLVI